MALNFRTTTKVDSARDYKRISADLKKLDKVIPHIHADLRMTTGKCMLAKSTMRYIDQMGTTEHLKNDQYEAVISSLKNVNPNYTLHDVYAGLENILEDYSKKVTTFTQTMITTVKQYATGLFDLFIKKSRLTDKIDVEKFVSIDSSMRMTIIKYDDYCRLGHPVVEHSAEVVKEVGDWHASLGRVKKGLATGDTEALNKAIAELTKKINDGKLVSYLKDNGIGTFEFSQTQVDGCVGLNKIIATDKFIHMEQPYLLSEAGWVDVDKLKNSIVLQQAESVGKNITQMYKLAVDLMDETRRISNEFCTKDPYTCAAMVKYASLVSQMINLYTKAFDMCWTTCLRVSQACLIEGA